MAGITRRPLRAAQMEEPEMAPPLAGPLGHPADPNGVHGAIQSLLLKMLMAKVGGGTVDGTKTPALFQGF